MPAELEQLEKLAENLWWTWNPQGRELFRSVDKELFKKVDQNPIELLSRLNSHNIFYV